MSDNRALLGMRRMVKSFSPFVADWDGINNLYVVDNPSVDWIQLTPDTHYQETYFDTSAYALDDLTIMPVSITMQEAGRYQATFPGSLRFLLLDLVTTEPISDLGAFTSAFQTSNQMSGFPGSNMDFTQVIYGRFREFLPVTQAATTQDILAPTCDQQFGSLEPTTASKLHIYRFIFNLGLPEIAAGRVRLPSARIILNADIIKEKDIPFLMRQKRSYELANY